MCLAAVITAIHAGWVHKTTFHHFLHHSGCIWSHHWSDKTSACPGDRLLMCSCMTISEEAQLSIFMRSEDKLSKETHVSFNAFVKFSRRWEDTEGEWETSAETGVIEHRNQIKKKKKRQTEGEKNKDGEEQACETKGWEGGTGANGEQSETMSDRSSREDAMWKQVRARTLQWTHNLSMRSTHTHKDRHGFKTISPHHSSSSFTRTDNKHTIFKRLLLNKTKLASSTDMRQETMKRIDSIPQMMVKENQWRSVQSALYPPTLCFLLHNRGFITITAFSGVWLWAITS